MAKRRTFKKVKPGEPIQESKSTKKSGNRPLFSQMLKDIEKGKYDAILAWHPTAYRVTRLRPEWLSIWSITASLKTCVSRLSNFITILVAN